MLPALAPGSARRPRRGELVSNWLARRSAYDLLPDRQLSLPVSTISQWCVSRSSKANVIFSSTGVPPLVANAQADKTGVPYRLRGSEPPPGRRSHERKLMIARAVKVFKRNRPGRVKPRRVMDQSGPTLEAFPGSATILAMWIVRPRRDSTCCGCGLKAMSR